MNTRIVWTSRQHELVVAGFLSVIRRNFPDMKVKAADDYVGSAFIKTWITEAQTGLVKDARRTYFTKKSLIELSEDVTRALWQLQLEDDTKQVLLGGLSTQTLLDEIARRQHDSLLESLVSRLEGPLNDRFGARLRVLEEALGLKQERATHGLGRQDQPLGPEIPEYVLVGLLPAQADALEEEFKGQATFVRVESSAQNRIKQLVGGRIVFVSRFVDHAVWNVCKAQAAETHFASNTREFKTQITAVLRTLSERA